MTHLTFGNELTKVYFDKEKGFLKKIEYKGRTIHLCSKLWSVQVKEGELTIADMTAFRHECYEGVLKLFWESHAAKVCVIVKNGEDGKLRFRIMTEVFGGEAVRRVRFPILEGMKFDTENYLLLTWQNGRILKNPVDTFLCKGVDVPFWVGRGKYGYEGEYPANLSFQFGAFYGQEYGYYFATEDPDAYIKTFAFDYNEGAHAMDFSVINYPENMGKTTSYCMAYDFVLKLFEGDWQTAAHIYRDWAIGQKWCKGKLAQKYIPEKLVKTDLWWLNFETTEGYSNFNLTPEELLCINQTMQKTLDCNVALHWYGWNRGVHDHDYPDYVSAEKKEQGWLEELAGWNQKFEEAGIVKFPYINARLWERTTASWEREHVHQAAIKTENGDYPHEPWAGRQLKPVCPATALWQNKVVDLCREYVLGCRFDGVYLDQIGSYNATVCFDENHPHPTGGGSWWNDSYHNMVTKVRQILGKDRIITTESCCETYIDLFDIMLVEDTTLQHIAFAALTDGNEQAVPLLGMIYGDYSLAYGSTCVLGEQNESFEFNLVRNLLWGILPCLSGVSKTWVNAPGDNSAVIKRVVYFYQENKDLILYGRLCEIPKYTCSATNSMDWVATDEQGGKHPYTDTFPAICATIWEDAQDKKQLLAYNFSESSQTMEMDGKTYEVNAKEFCKVAL
ncbi:MAG: hypothetical protein E7409_07860 [Ruminococcaceae bacterium]|nr:hypothetical protein [Oscillospiraceae bacterium]